MRRLPEGLRRFLAGSIASVEELEVLLLIQRPPLRYWDAAAVADYLAMRQSAVATALERLAGQNLLDVRLSEAIKYRFNPAAADQRDCVRMLSEAWRDSRETVVRELTKRHSLTDFSDAFRIGKDADRG